MIGVGCWLVLERFKIQEFVCKSLWKSQHEWRDIVTLTVNLICGWELLGSYAYVQFRFELHEDVVFTCYSLRQLGWRVGIEFRPDCRNQHVRSEESIVVSYHGSCTLISIVFHFFQENKSSCREYGSIIDGREYILFSFVLNSFGVVTKKK